MIVKTFSGDIRIVSAQYFGNVEIGDFVDVIIDKPDGTIYTEREQVIEIIEV